MIQQSLLRTVVPDVIAGDLGKLREGSEKSNGGNVRAGLGPREKLDVIGEEGCVVALADEISFADGFVRKRSVKGRGRQRHTKDHEQATEEANEVTHQGFPRGQYSADSDAGYGRNDVVSGGGRDRNRRRGDRPQGESRQ